MGNKRRCCCCIRLSDGVILVGLYGASFHAGLLIIQCTHGHTLTPPANVDPFADTVVQPVVLAVHSAGVVVNVLLVIGAHFCYRLLMLPWLLSQGLLASVLAALALYYLSLFPNSECSSSSKTSADVTAKTFKDRAATVEEDCHVLLWHSVVMILSILVVCYYFFVVHEFVAQTRSSSSSSSSSRTKEPKAKYGVEIAIEAMEVQQQEQHQQQEQQEQKQQQEQHHYHHQEQQQRRHIGSPLAEAIMAQQRQQQRMEEEAAALSVSPMVPPPRPPKTRREGGEKRRVRIQEPVSSLQLPQ